MISRRFRCASLLALASLSAATHADLTATELDAAVRAIEPKVIEWRRDFHQHPELSNREVRTAEVVAKRLRAMGLEARTGIGLTGVAALLRGGRPGPTIALRADTSLRFSPTLSATRAGFSLHAATTAAADDLAGREALCRYVLRPPIAQDRLRLLDDGLVRIELKRAFYDGTVAVDLDPLSLLCRLATAVPPPRFHVVRYAGVLASAHKWRSLVVPPRPPADDNDETREHAHAHDTADEPPTTHPLRVCVPRWQQQRHQGLRRARHRRGADYPHRRR